MRAEGVTVGETCTLYYDRSKGALPSTSKLVFKAGLNRWETIQLVDMARAEGFNQGGGSEWWSVDITLPQVMLSSMVVDLACQALNLFPGLAWLPCYCVCPVWALAPLAVLNDRTAAKQQYQHI